MLNVAERFNLTYVCQPGDFDSSDHSTGNLGFLFGCTSASEATGKRVVSSNALPAGLSQKKTQIVNMTDKKNSHLDLPIEDNSLYVLHGDCLGDRHQGRPMEAFGESYKWFRSQYHHVRKLDEKRLAPSCWNVSTGKTKIAVHVRRGDDDEHRGKNLDFYMQVLSSLFQCRVQVKGHCVKEQDADVVVIAETSLSDPEMQPFLSFKQAVVRLMLGPPEKKPERARERFMDDLDCMSVADVLITSGGGFSALAAAVLHDEGVSLAFAEDNYRDDMPNAIHGSLTGSSLLRRHK